jgi:hypothetical protein
VIALSLFVGLTTPGDDNRTIQITERELAFQNVKKRLTEAPILAYFDTNKEVVLQVDAVLLHDGKPVEFASRALRRVINILLFASCIQLAKLRIVIALSLFVGLTTPGDGKRTIQITNCFGKLYLKYFARYLQSER